MRPRFDDIYMRLALMLSRRSTCSRLQVGCVITSIDYRYVYGVGYNGNATGMKNACDREEVGNCGCLHAEENAVINCTASRDAPKFVFCTNLPCAMCAKRLINLGGVQKVFYHLDYRMRDAFELFDAACIAHEHLSLNYNLHLGMEKDE